MAETVGTIGTMYECRKNGKIGVLESRDDKYKTLLFRDENGGSFNITYSTFKSNWRKYTGDKAIKTSKQITEKKVEAEKKAEQASQSLDDVKPVTNKGDHRKPMFDRLTKTSIAEEVKSLVDDAILSAELELNTVINSKGGVMVKKRGKKLFEVWPDFSKNPVDTIHIPMYKELWNELEFPKKVGDIQAEYYEKWKLQYMAIVPKKVIEPALATIMSTVSTIYFKEEEE